MESNRLLDENCGSRLYIGNLDQRLTESNLIKLFSPFGKIISEDFLYHTRGPKRGEPRGYAFIQYSCEKEAQLAKSKMHGKLVGGRPLVVRLASEKCLIEATNGVNAGDAKRTGVSGNLSGQLNKSVKIAAIKNKLKALENEGCSMKKPRVTTEGSESSSTDCADTH